MRFGNVFLLAMGMVGPIGAGTTAAGSGQGGLPARQDTRHLALIQVGAAPVADATAYDRWLNGAIEKLSGDDESEQRKAADQLTLGAVYPPALQKVLAALEPHLNGNNKDFRLRCVKAYGHWATAAQAPQLLAVVASPPNPPQMSGAEPCWAAAVAALVSIDPDADRKGMGERVGNFFFRSDLTGALVTMTADNGPAQPKAFELLKQLDPSNAAVQLSVADSIALLRSDAAADRTKGANSLAHAVIEPSEQATILGLLKPHLNGSNGRARLAFVQAFAHWATPGDVAALESVVASPATVSGISGHEDCWAAATIGLARLDPAAAATALKSRAGVFFYRAAVQRQLEFLAAGHSPSAAVASWLLVQLEAGPGNNPPPLPPNFDPGDLAPAGAPGHRTGCHDRA